MVLPAFGVEIPTKRPVFPANQDSGKAYRGEDEQQPSKTDFLGTIYKGGEEKMKTCVVCQKELPSTKPPEAKYCDRFCKRARYWGITRAEYFKRQEENKKQFAEDAKRAGEAGYGNCVIFRDDGGYNRQYLTRDGTWTVDRYEAARCLSWDDADELAKKYGVVFFGGVSDREPTCDIFSFRYPEDYDKWLSWSGVSEIDAEDGGPTERFILANLESALPHLKIEELLRAAKGQNRDL